MRHCVAFVLLMTSFVVFADDKKMEFDGNWGPGGFSVVETKSNGEGLILNYSINSLELKSIQINGNTMSELHIPGHFLPNDEGMPNLPGTGRFVAVPTGADVKVKILDRRVTTITDVYLSPAPQIPFDDEDGPLVYKMNKEVYSKNVSYPQSILTASKNKKLRGVEAVLVGVTPFEYNPVQKTLNIYSDVRIEVTFEGEKRDFGDQRLRSRWWDPMLRDAFVNFGDLPKVDYAKANKGTGYEYLIITPNDPIFVDYALKIKHHRNLQGIHTGVVTTEELGGNTTEAIEAYVNNAYNTWDTPPAAVLLIGDYGSEGATITSPKHANYCVSDNMYADVDGDDLPDIAFGRIVAQNEEQLANMVDKFINYEMNPPKDPNFYKHPISALGWQHERWFQICSEVVGGFWKNSLGKEPVRQNALYSGSTDTWSSATNTAAVLEYFGPEGLGYIPADPTHLTDWGGNAEGVNAALNAGAFMLQHRDHGSLTGWGEPDYGISNLTDLRNENPTFIFSINCLTGKYNNSSEVFAEAFHRMPVGALGLIAASEISYSFVNDTFVWGMYDNMWANFMPAYGEEVEVPNNILPAFANVAGKIFLEQSGWPYNTSNKLVTYHLFHHFGDAFSTVYSEVPTALSVSHPGSVTIGVPNFTVSADKGALIALTIDGAIIGVGTSNGSPVVIPIGAVQPGKKVIVTATKQNHLRYQKEIPVISSSTPYISVSSFEVVDDNNGQPDYGETVDLTVTLTNFGMKASSDFTMTLSSESEFVEAIPTSTAGHTGLAPNESAVVEKAFRVTFKSEVPDQSAVNFKVIVEDDADARYESMMAMNINAPVFDFGFAMAQAGGLKPGETRNFVYTVTNSGHAPAHQVTAALSEGNGVNLTIAPATVTLGEIAAGGNAEATFAVGIGADVSTGTTASFNLATTNAGAPFSSTQTLKVIGMTEDFESGDFGALPWGLEGHSNWIVQDSNVYAGALAAKSGDLSDGQNSNLSLAITVGEGSEVRFYAKISSEENYDKLKFYIDEVEKKSLSGLIDWTEYVEALEPGPHTLKWEYKKDGTLSKNDDAVYLDNILIKGMQ